VTVVQRGWLERQSEKVDEDLKTWPAWLLKVSGLDENQQREILESAENKRAVGQEKAVVGYPSR
jgi:hypothetical protein